MQKPLGDRITANSLPWFESVQDAPQLTLVHSREVKRLHIALLNNKPNTRVVWKVINNSVSPFIHRHITKVFVKGFRLSQRIDKQTINEQITIGYVFLK